MQLTRYTDYSLRVLTYLALLPESQMASVDEISEAYDISRNNVNKIIHQLGKAGIITTKRGKGGGFYLAKPLEEINIGELVELLENTLEVVNCSAPRCKILPACRLKHLLNDATQAFIDHLKQYSLADLVTDNQPELINLLDISLAKPA